MDSYHIIKETKTSKYTVSLKRANLYLVFSRLLLNREPKKFDDSWKKDPIDNVYVAKYFKWVVYPFAEAVQCHRETHHPEMYNKPNANLYATVELNMQGEKKVSRYRIQILIQ